MQENIFTNTCLNVLTPEELTLFEDRKSQVTYLKGETIIKQNALAANIIYITNGLVRMYNQSAGAKQINLRLVKTGDFMALFSIFDNKTYPYSATAVTDTTVCMIEKSALIELMLSNPQFALKMTSTNYQREHRYLDIINSLAFKQMRGKLATSLLYLSSEYFQDTNVFNFLTRQEIADFASITTESAIKFLKEFEKESILSLSDKTITILDRKALERISNIG